MQKKIVLNSAAEALELINQQQLKFKRSEEDILLFRGQTREYPTMFPSLFRQPEVEWENIRLLVGELSYNLLAGYLEPYLVFRSDGPYYKGKWVGRID